MSKAASHDAVVIHHSDNVATLLRDARKGEALRIRDAGSVRILTCVEDIALCHKIALVAMQAGDTIRKYGEIIGQATSAVAPGAHVHVHNMRTRRGQLTD